MDSGLRLGAFLHNTYYSDGERTFTYIPSDVFLLGLKKYGIHLASVCAKVKKTEHPAGIRAPLTLEQKGIRLYSLPFWTDTAHLFKILPGNWRRFKVTIRRFVSSVDILWVRTPSPLLGLILREARRRKKPVVIHAAGSMLDAWRNIKHKGYKRPLVMVLTRLMHHYTRYLVRNHITLATGPNLISLFSGSQRRLIPFVDSQVKGPSTRSPRKVDHLRLLYVGRLIRRKGLSCVFRALSILKKAGVGARFTVIGTGADEKALKREAGRLGVSDSVIWKGFVPRGPSLDREYLQADVCILASQASEGFPRTILEAWAQGTVVAVSRVRGLKDIVDDGENGLVFPPEDPRALAECLIRIYENPELQKGLRAGGYESLEPYTYSKQLKLARKALLSAFKHYR